MFNKKGYVAKNHLPVLPDRYNGQVSFRLPKLEKYLDSLLNINTSFSNQHILSFIGAASSYKDESRLSYQPSISCPIRNVIHISNLSNILNWGDVILFRCSNSMSGLQRLATGSEWDHVGLITMSPMRRAKGNAPLMLLESTSDGVTVFPAIPRLNAYIHYGIAEAIVIRQYNGERSLNMYNHLTAFVERVVGLPYSFNISKLFAGLYHSKINKTNNVKSSSQVKSKSEGDTQNPLSVVNNSIITNTPQPSNVYISKNTRLLSYFCSEVVAAALITCGIINDSSPPSVYWPGSFSAGKELDIGCAAYGYSLLP